MNLFKREIKLYLLFIIGLSVNLCCSRSNEQLKHDIELLKNEPIRIPYKNLLIYQGHQQIPIKKLEKPYRLIVYIDSVQCSSCSLQEMYHWEPFIDSISKYNNKVDICFIFSPPKKKLEMIKKKILRENFKYPIYVDTCGSFLNANKHIPNNSLLHTFMIDKNDSVVLIGNPHTNPKIRDLLFSIINSRNN